MAYPKEVNNVKVSEGTQFDRTGGTSQVRTVTYYVGDHGPFYYTKPVAEFTTDTVTRSMEDTVKMLRSIGALPSGG
jgi:hypothetical protein